MTDIKFVVEEKSTTQEGKQELELFDSKVYPKEYPEINSKHKPNSFTENSHHSDEQEEEKELTVRLDKWLWAARFFKTRALARTAVENSKVLYNGKVTSPNTEIEIGSTIAIFPGKYPRIDLVIRGLSTRRRNAADANELFTQIKTPINFKSDQEQSNYKSSHSHPYCRKRTNTGKDNFGFKPQEESNSNYHDSQQPNKKRNSTTRFLRGRKQHNKPESGDSFENGFHSEYRT